MKKNYIFILYLTCLCVPVSLSAAQICITDSILPSTPNEQLVDNSNGTVSDLKTGLMWRKCVEGVSGLTCDIGYSVSFNWQQALERPSVVNTGGGFAGYTDWRLPNIRDVVIHS